MIYTFTLNPAVDYYISLPTEIMWDEVTEGLMKHTKLVERD